MPVAIKTSFLPFRLSLSDKGPVQLTVELHNLSPEKKKLSLMVALPRTLCFSKEGMRNVELVRIDTLQPGEVKHLYFDIYPKVGLEPGVVPIHIKLQEHYTSYQYTANEASKTVELRVVE